MSVLRQLLVACVVIGAMLNAAFAAERGVSDVDGAHEDFRLVNEFRAQNGKASLQWDERLAEAALRHAYLCAENKGLSHQFAGEPVLNLRLAKFNIRLNRAGENLALDSSVSGAHEGLMLSPPHRATMLSGDYNAVGIAVVRAKGRFYVVQDFAHVLPDSTVAQVEEQIEAGFDALRTKSKAPALTHSTNERLRELACEMARNDKVDASHSPVTGARYVLAFTTSDPQSLPGELTELRSSREVGSYAIGACFAKSNTYVNGTYWVLMALYPSSAGTRQRRTGGKAHDYE